MISKASKRVESAGLFLPLPKEIASYFPYKEEDESKPHVTILYFGNVLEDDKDLYKKACEIAVAKNKIGKVNLDKLSFFKNQEDQWIAHNPVHCEGLGELRKQLWDGCDRFGLEIQDGFRKFKPHATLAYLDEKKYYDDYYVGSGKTHNQK